MNEKEKVYIDEPSRLPSITGKDVIELEVYAKLPRTRSYDAIKAFLEEARRSIDVNVRFIVAEWGEGKTSIYEGLLKSKEVIKSDLVIPIPTKRLIVHIKEKGGLFSDTGSLGARFLACLLYAIKDIVENELFSIPPFNKIKIKPKSQRQSTTNFIEEGLKSILNAIDPNARVFTFLDEFEDIVDETRDIRELIRGGLVEVINGEPRCLNEEPFRGRLHILISATPPAYEKLVSEVPADTRRLFGQRALKIELEKLDRKNAYQYILGVLKYCWDGRLPKVPFSEPGMFNTIYLSTLGNPRSIINLLKMLLMHAKINAPEGKIKCIEPEDFIHAISGRSIEVYGGEVHLVDKNAFERLLSKLKGKCEKLGLDFEKCKKLMYSLLANLSPMSIREIGRKLGEDLSPYISAISSCFQELWGIERPFLFFKKVTNKTEELDLLLSSSDVPSHLSKVLSALEFYEFDQEGSSLSSVLYVPYKKLAELDHEDKPLYRNYIEFFITFSPELRSEDEIRILVDRYLFDRVKKSEEYYVMLSQAAINLFYPSPSFFFLDFIEDVNRRFKIGIELTRQLTSFEEEFKEGIVYLLIEGGHSRGIKVERTIESHRTFKDVEVIRLTYSETIQQYSVRARILPALRVSGDDFRKRVEAIFNEMKEAKIPVLLIFSWNPLPLEAKSILETFFSPRRGLERIFHYLEFPLTEFQCHQIIGYILAKKYGYKIREEKWKARALRILDEIKFEDSVKKFISDGIQNGYTLRKLTLKELKQDEVPGFLKTLLITEGDVERRWRTITSLEEKFRIYGKEFPICPKDIESITQFERCIDDLKDDGLVKESDDGTLEVHDTPIERRILSILEEYNRPLSADEINNLFISVVSSPREPSPIDSYLKILEGKKKVSFDKKEKVYSLYESDVLSETKKLKEMVRKLKDQYSDSSYGYLASIKQRDVSTIIVKECMRVVEELIESLEKTPLLPGYEERRRRKHILLETLIEQLDEIIKLSDNFYRKYLSMYGDVKRYAESLKSQLKKLEEKINNLHIADKRLEIKEIEELSKRLAEIEEVEKKVYTEDEVRNLALRLHRSYHKLPEGFYEEYKNCPVFDVKIIQMVNENEDMKMIIDKYVKCIREVEDTIDKIVELRKSISQHKIFTSKYEGVLSSTLQAWVINSMKKSEVYSNGWK